MIKKRLYFNIKKKSFYFFVISIFLNFSVIYCSQANSLANKLSEVYSLNEQLRDGAVRNSLAYLGQVFIREHAKLICDHYLDKMQDFSYENFKSNRKYLENLNNLLFISRETTNIIKDMIIELATSSILLSEGYVACMQKKKLHKEYDEDDNKLYATIIKECYEKPHKFNFTSFCYMDHDLKKGIGSVIPSLFILKLFWGDNNFFTNMLFEENNNQSLMIYKKLKDYCIFAPIKQSRIPWDKEDNHNKVKCNETYKQWIFNNIKLKNDNFTVSNNSIIKIKNSSFESSLHITVTKHQDDKTPFYIDQLLLEDISTQNNEFIIDINGNTKNTIINYCKIKFNETSLEPTKISFKNCDINELEIIKSQGVNTLNIEMDNGRCIQKCTISHPYSSTQQQVVFSETYNIKSLRLMNIKYPHIIPDILQTINKNALETFTAYSSNNTNANVDLNIDLTEFSHLKTINIHHSKSPYFLEKYTLNLPDGLKNIELRDSSAGRSLWDIKSLMPLVLDSYKISINENAILTIDKNPTTTNIEYGMYGKDTFDYLKKNFSLVLEKAKFSFLYNEQDLDFSCFNHLQDLKLSNYNKNQCEIVLPGTLKNLELYTSHFNEAINAENNVDDIYVWHNESDTILISRVQEFINYLNKETIKKIYLKLSCINEENDQIIDFEGFDHLEKITIYTYRKLNNVEIKNAPHSCSVEIINKKISQSHDENLTKNTTESVNEQNNQNNSLENIQALSNQKNNITPTILKIGSLLGLGFLLFWLTKDTIANFKFFCKK